MEALALSNSADNSSQGHNNPRLTRADCEVAVIGAGPYGLSMAAHLQAKGVRVRVFGTPMEFWAEKMPEGMLLRSPRVASNISDPAGTLGLEAYENACNRPPSAPVPLRDFVEYGRWFCHGLSDCLDRRNVVRLGRENGEFSLALEDGKAMRVRRVIVAAGIGSFKRKPVVFKHLDSALASHCYEGRRVRDFMGKRVAVIGAGQSALESAALLHEAGAEVEVIAKIPQLRWIGMHPRLHQLGPISAFLYSQHDVGPAGISRLVAMPKLMRHVPIGIRDRIRTRAVRPAGSKWLPQRLSKVKVATGRVVLEARAVGHEVRLKLDDGSDRSVDHVLMGTGYSVDIRKYDFLSRELVDGIRVLDGYPILTSGFCSSVPGLHFVGATAARTFGPLLYFVAGTDFASREVAAYVARQGSGTR